MEAFLHGRAPESGGIIYRMGWRRQYKVGLAQVVGIPVRHELYLLALKNLTSHSLNLVIMRGTFLAI